MLSRLELPSRSAQTVPVTSIRLLGVRIDCLRLADLLRRVLASVRSHTPTTVLYVNVHCMNVQHNDHHYGQILEHADTVYCDGTGVRLAARLAGLNIPERMTGADWISDLCHLAIREHLSLFLVGSEPGTAAKAARLLQTTHPGLHIAGTAAGYDAGSAVITRINQSAPDILLVGMGTPTQEKWIAAHREQLNAPVVWAVGALFDFVTGRIPRGPRWMTEHGMEWICRLAAEPRKLWRRYLIGNPHFLWRIIKSRFLPR